MKHFTSTGFLRSPALGNLSANRKHWITFILVREGHILMALLPSLALEPRKQRTSETKMLEVRWNLKDHPVVPGLYCSSPGQPGKHPGNYCSHSPSFHGCSASAQVTSCGVPSKVKAMPCQFCILAAKLCSRLVTDAVACLISYSFNEHLLDTY